MDIYEVLREDHRKISALFDELLASGDEAARAPLFSEIRQQLNVHTETEQATFYDALAERPGAADLIHHAEDEHDAIEEQITLIAELPASDGKWLQQVIHLRDLVARHVDEEEGPIFEKARRVFNNQQADILGSDMENLKQTKARQRWLADTAA